MIGIIIGFVILEISDHIRKNYAYRRKPKGIVRKYYIFKIKVRFVYAYSVYEICELLTILGNSQMEKLCWIIMLKSGLMIFKNMMILEPKLALTISDTLQNYYSKVILAKL